MILEKSVVKELLFLEIFGMIKARNYGTEKAVRSECVYAENCCKKTR